MSRIDELIAELCPRGVPSRPIADFARESSVRNRSQAVTEVRSITNSRGLTPTSEVFENMRTSSDTSNYKVVQPGMFVYNPSRINVGSISWLEEESPVIVSPMYVVFGINREIILPEYLMLFLGSRIGKSKIESKTEVGARFRLTYVSLSRIVVPVPPLEVQREIVRILDQFTQLEGELEAELEARRRQYDFYRDSLISSSTDARRFPLGDLGSIFGGLTGKSKADFSDGNARFASYRNVFSNIALDTEAEDFVRVADGERQRSLAYGDVIFTGSSESFEEVGMTSVVTKQLTEPIYLNSFCIGFRPNDVRQLDPEFAKHLFRASVMRSQIIKTASGVTRINVSKARLAKIQVPIPERSEQARIAQVLDRFEALTKSLSVGLPAELAARRKQYEYYRDKLLTFEEAAA